MGELFNNKRTWCFHKIERYILMFTMQTYKELITEHFLYFRCDFEVEVMQTLGNDKDFPKGKNVFIYEVAGCKLINCFLYQNL